MDNSAVAETITVDGILHWLVVSVGINTQTVYFAMTEIKAGSGNAFDLTVGGNPVNCAVRLIGVPGTIFNDGIIRFSSYNECLSGCLLKQDNCRSIDGDCRWQP